MIRSTKWAKRIQFCWYWSCICYFNGCISFQFHWDWGSWPQGDSHGCKLKCLLLKLYWSQHDHDNYWRMDHDPASIYIAQSYYTLNCDMAVSGSVFKLWTQTKPNSFKLHVIIEVNEFKNKTFWMSISYLTQVLLINTLCIIFIYFFKRKIPSILWWEFWRSWFGNKTPDQQKINNTHYRMWIWSRIRFC